MEPNATRTIRVWLGLAVLLFVTLLSFWPLSVHWSADPQYHFGYLVPILAGLLTGRRWLTRPDAGPPIRIANAIAFLGGLLFLPIWVLLQPNPDWRLLNWGATALACTFVLAIIASIAGWVWVRYFAFPVLFLLTAVPWPTSLEWPVTHGLMHWVAAITAELLTLGGIPAVAQGNLVEIASGTLGVDLACSGIRSLQASLMMALFLGELLRISLSRRVLLVVGSVVIAVLANIGRILILARAAASNGVASIDRWHDPAGLLLLTACFVLLWLMALLLGRGQSLPQFNSGLSRSVNISSRWPILLIAWMLVSVAVSEWWFQRRESELQSPWLFTPPPYSSRVPIDDDAMAMLRFDNGAGWKWNDAEGNQWVAYDFHWKPGSARSRMLLSMHRPDVCLAAVGLPLLEDRGAIPVNAADVTIPFHAYRFSSPNGPLFVFYALYRNGTPVLAGEDSVRTACFRAVAQRQRALNQQVLQIAVIGPSDGAEADRALRSLLKKLVTPHTSAAIK